MGHGAKLSRRATIYTEEEYLYVSDDRRLRTSALCKVEIGLSNFSMSGEVPEVCWWRGPRWSRKGQVTKFVSYVT